MDIKSFKSRMAQVEGMDITVVDFEGNRYQVVDIDYISPKGEFVGLNLKKDQFVELEMETITQVLGNGIDAFDL